MSEEDPSVVMEFLLSVQQFDLAADWAELHNLPSHFHKVRDNNYAVVCIVESRYNELLYNEVPAITNDILQPAQSYSNAYGTEPQNGLPP